MKEKLINQYIELYIAKYGAYENSSIQETQEQIRAILEQNTDKVIIDSSFNGGQFEYGIVKSNTRRLSTLIHELRHAHTSKKGDPKYDGLNFELDNGGVNPIIVNILDEAVTEKTSSEMLGKAPNAYFSAVPFAYILGEMIGHENLRLAQENHSFETVKELFGSEKLAKLEPEMEMLSATTNSNSTVSHDFCNELKKYFAKEIDKISKPEGAQILANKINNIDNYLHEYNVSKNGGYIHAIGSVKEYLKRQFPMAEISTTAKSKIFVNMLKDNIRYVREYQPKAIQNSGILKGISQTVKLVGSPLIAFGIAGNTVFEANAHIRYEKEMLHEIPIAWTKYVSDPHDPNESVSEYREKENVYLGKEKVQTPDEEIELLKTAKIDLLEVQKRMELEQQNQILGGDSNSYEDQSNKKSM